MVALKRREKMAYQRSMTQKKGEKKGVTMSQKKEKERETGMIRERKAITSRSKPYSSIYPSIHTLAPFDRDCMTCFSMDPLFDFTINRIQVCPVLILPWAPQRLVVVGKIKGKHCLGKEIQDECLERVILGALPCFQKSFKKKVSPDGLRIYQQVSTTLCTVLTLNSPRQGDGWKAPWKSKVIEQRYANQLI